MVEIGDSIFRIFHMSADRLPCTVTYRPTECGGKANGTYKS